MMADNRAFLIACAFMALIVCPGCAEWSATAAQSSARTDVRDIQQANDLNAQIWAATACAAPYGEMVRNGSGNPGYPAAVIELCGVPPGLMRAPK